MSSEPARIRVLHVDDDTDFGDLVSTFLEQEGPEFSVDSVRSADEGLDRLAEYQYDCIVSDYQMPGQNGIEFLNAIRTQYPDLPFILFTGKGREEIASEAVSAEVTDYLQKGTGSDQYTILSNRVANAVSGYRARKRASRMADQLEAIRENVGEVIWISSPEKDEIRFVSDAYREVWGRPPESLLSDPSSFVDAVHPDDEDRVRAALGRQGNIPEEYDETYRVVQPDGSVRWVHDSASGIYDNGMLTGIVGIATDITELKHSEQVLQEEQTFIQSALEAAVEFYWGIDLDGYVTRWSDTDGTVTGYSTAEAIGLHTSTFHPDDHFSRIEQAIDEMKRTGSVRVEADLLTKDGQCIPFEFIGSVITDEAGSIRSMCGIGRDISAENTEQVGSELDSDTDFAQIVANNMKDVALIVNQDTQIVYANQRLGDILAEPSSVIGADAVKALTALTEDSAVIEQYVSALKTVLDDADEQSVTVPVSLPHGEMVLDLRFTPYWDNGTITAAVIIAREITEREQLKDQLLYLNQLLRHDIRSDLSVINGYAELIDEDLPGHNEEINAIISACQHGFELTQTAQEFIRVVTGDDPAQNSPQIEITPLIQAEVEQSRLIHPDAEITISGELPGVHVQANELLGSIVRNLLTNAVRHNSNPEPTVVVSLKESIDAVELRVADNGPGISDDRNSEIFDQNHKGANSTGSGLGLYLVEQIVNEFGGEVWITDNEPTGAIFHIKLPKSS